MAQTPFLPEQKEDSDQINLDYSHLIYPYIFNIEDVVYDWKNLTKEDKEYFDREWGVDYSFQVRFPGFIDLMRFLVQYRFRDAQEFQRFQDLTITLHNDASNLPGEFAKILAQFFVYGYYVKSTCHLIEVLVADCQRMRINILNGTLPYTTGRNPRTRQPFVAVKFADLYAHNLVLLHWKEVNRERQWLYGGPRQVNPNTSLNEGIARAKQGYTHKGQPRIALSIEEVKQLTINYEINQLRGEWEDNE